MTPYLPTKQTLRSNVKGVRLVPQRIQMAARNANNLAVALKFIHPRHVRPKMEQFMADLANVSKSA